MKRFFNRILRGHWLLLFSLLSQAPLAFALPAGPVAYVAVTPNATSAYLLEPLGPGRARVVNSFGAAEGSLVESGSQVVVTLDTPISNVVTARSLCFDESSWEYRRDVQKLVFRRDSGSEGRGRSGVVEIGVSTGLNVCHGGETRRFGGMADRGRPMLHLALSQHAPTDDLVPGAELAGMSEGSAESPTFPTAVAPAADRVTFLPGGQLRFEASGHVVPASKNEQGWWELNLGSAQRIYLRLQVDAVTGGERWLRVEQEEGRAQMVHQALMVRSDPLASFGPVEEAARNWLDEFSRKAPIDRTGCGQKVSYSLRPDWTGERRCQSSTSKLRWEFVGSTIEQARQPFSAGYEVTIWHPLAKAPGGWWVLDSDGYRYTASGAFSASRLPAIRLLTDEGPAGQGGFSR